MAFEIYGENMMGIWKNMVRIYCLNKMGKGKKISEGGLGISDDGSLGIGCL